jgi:hypothetical protein
MVGDTRSSSARARGSTTLATTPRGRAAGPNSTREYGVDCRAPTHFEEPVVGADSIASAVPAASSGVGSVKSPAHSSLSTRLGSGLRCDRGDEASRLARSSPSPCWILAPITARIPTVGMYPHEHPILLAERRFSGRLGVSRGAVQTPARVKVTCVTPLGEEVAST